MFYFIQKELEVISIFGESHEVYKKDETYIEERGVLINIHHVGVQIHL